MNRCKCCNVLLTEYEESFQYTFGEPIELCLDCLKETTLFEDIEEDE